MRTKKRSGRGPSPSSPPRGRTRRRRTPYPPESRLKAVRLAVEEGIPIELIGKELGVCPETIGKWVKRYRTEGEAGLADRPKIRGGGEHRVPPAVKEKIAEVKRDHPRFGIRRIAQTLRRVLFLPGSAETVRRTLHEKKLLVRKRPKAKRKPPSPRFFERSTPNQLWQSDIFCFRLGGKNAYLIGYIDDHSRYVVGLDLFRSQTGEHVLEVYRVAVGEYGVPKEMLTDNGRQYTNWRGRTRFEAEMRKDRVHHFRSRPHHPMTLGKIERFWKTISEEFLERARFESYESARERIRLWVKYYNHRRPHQGIEGLCPADRFFAIQKGLREVMERGIQENVEELALRGEVKSPFYMVGRMGEQSVVIRAERGKVRMLVDGEERDQELVHDLEEKGHGEDGGGDGEGDSGQEGGNGDGGGDAQRAGANGGGAGGVDGAAAAGGGVPGDGDTGGVASAVAGSGAEGYAGCAGAEGNGDREGSDAPGTAGEAAQPADGGACGAADAAVKEAGEDTGGEGRGEERLNGVKDAGAEQEDGGPRAGEGGGDHPGACGGDDRAGGGAEAGGIEEDVLQVGGAGAAGDGGGGGGAGEGTAAGTGGSGEGAAAEGAGRASGAGEGAGAAAEDTGSAG